MKLSSFLQSTLATAVLLFTPAAWGQTSMKDADNPARAPFQAGASLIGLNGNEVLVASPPPAKRLVIEFVTMDCVTAPGHNIYSLKMKTTAGGEREEHRLTVQPQGLGPGFSYFSVSQPVRIYADGATGITFLGRSTAPNGGGQCNITISGHFVTLVEGAISRF